MNRLVDKHFEAKNIAMVPRWLHLSENTSRRLIRDLLFKNLPHTKELFHIKRSYHLQTKAMLVNWLHIISQKPRTRIIFTYNLSRTG